uniref:twin-arginine translocase subunit TatC n=1 Tax=Alistipes sp. TaxID=1872444 RepID=UPI0040566260
MEEKIRGNQNLSNGETEELHEDSSVYDDLSSQVMTMGEHLEELRTILLRILSLTLLFFIAAFICKDQLFGIIFAPSNSDFTLYRVINSLLSEFSLNSMLLSDFEVEIINTELSSQFMTHIQVAFYAALLATSPYIVYQLFLFIRPALYENERRYSLFFVTAIYLLFAVGILMNYYVIFPISFRFLGTYQVAESVLNTITLSSYISSFTILSFMMGIVFEMPILSFLLGKFGIITADMLITYRKFAIVVILIISALITPPDVFTLILMTIPLYLLYEISILILKKMRSNG